MLEIGCGGAGLTLAAYQHVGVRDWEGAGSKRKGGGGCEGLEAAADWPRRGAEDDEGELGAAVLVSEVG